MNTAPATEASPEVLLDRDAGLVAAFEMFCERMGNLENFVDHLLRHERQKEWMQDGQVDTQFLGIPLTVTVYRGGNHPIRPLTPLWRAVNIAFDDSCSPANLDAGDTQRLRTEEAMQRLKVPGKLLWNGDDAITCAEVGLDSDFTHLVDAVSEEMFKQAFRSEGTRLRMLGYATSGDPSLFLETSDDRPPEYWVGVVSRALEYCGIPATRLEIHPLQRDLARVLVPYERSSRAAPHKKRALLLKSQRLYRAADRFTIKQALRDCELVDLDDVLADFQNL